MKCVDCCYYWKEDYEDRPQCHWEARCPGDMATCDEDDYYDEEFGSYYDEEDY